MLPMNTPSSALIQSARNSRLPLTSRTRLTTASTTRLAWWGRAVVRGTMCSRRSAIGITTQMRIMKSIHSASAKRRKPQINNNTAINEPINPIHNPSPDPSRRQPAIKIRPFSRHSPAINSSSSSGDPSTRTIRFIPTGGICCLKIICEYCADAFFTSSFVRPVFVELEA